MTLPKKLQKYLISNEYFRQSFRTGNTYTNQQKLTTEASKDAIETTKTPAGEFVRPYNWISYKEMEYFLLAPSGQADARKETPWDTPWAQPQDSEARAGYYGGADVPGVSDLFYTSKDLLFVPLGSDGLSVSVIRPVTYIGFIDSDGETFIPSGTDALNVRE